MQKLNKTPDLTYMADIYNPLIHILWNACPSEAEGNHRTFRIESHCVAWTIEAVLQGDMSYEILSMTSEPC
jgi:hypothetical protein